MGIRRAFVTLWAKVGVVRSVFQRTLVAESQQVRARDGAAKGGKARRKTVGPLSSHLTWRGLEEDCSVDLEAGLPAPVLRVLPFLSSRRERGVCSSS